MMHKKEEIDGIAQEVVRRLQDLERFGPHPDSPAEMAIAELRRERHLTWEELNRPACPW